MPTEFKHLTQAQAIDPAWKLSLKPQLTLRLEQLRDELERPNVTPERTASLRGNIALLKELLALETDQATARRRQAAMQMLD